MSAPFDPSEWTTPAAALRTYGVPVEITHAAMLSGDLSVRCVAGETLVRHAEVRALRLRLMGDVTNATSRKTNAPGLAG